MGAVALAFVVGDVSQPPAVDLAPGRVLVGRYELVRLAGSGGMAQVWEAHDRVLARRVAIKLLHRHLASAASIQRFRQEGVAAAKLTHPNVVSIYDTISINDSEALVMEFVEGTTLRAHLDRQRSLGEADARHVATAVADALAAAHRQHLVHRDIKPANILLCSNGQVKITDFGIAKAAEGAGLTKEGTLVGTAAYLAPEQLESRPVDGRADLYALGLVLYESLAGRPAFTGDTDAAVALARLRSDAPDIASVAPSVSPEFAAVIRRMLRRDPAARYQSADELRRELAAPPRPAINSAPAAAVEPTQHPTAAFEQIEDDEPPDRRWMLPAAVVSIVVVALLVAAALLVDPESSEISSSTTQPPVDVTSIPVVDAHAVDPQGDGSESNSRVANSYDGNLETAWRTESYDSRTFEGVVTNGVQKSGVGIEWSVAGPSAFATLTVDSPTNDWSASVYVLNDPAEFDPAAEPQATVEHAQAGKTSFDLEGATGRSVVLWLTDLGDGPPRVRVEITEMSLLGTPQ